MADPPEGLNRNTAPTTKIMTTTAMMMPISAPRDGLHPDVVAELVAAALMPRSDRALMTHSPCWLLLLMSMIFALLEP